MKTADFLKSVLIIKKGYEKNNLTVEEIGLPLDHSRKECRADIYNIDKNTITIFEIKSSKQDFNTDFNKLKYRKYLKYCHLLYFVVKKDLYDYVHDKLFPEDDKEFNKGIGIYTVSDKGFLQCKKKASNTKNEICLDTTTGYINTQLKYRYYKQHMERFKEHIKG